MGKGGKGARERSGVGLEGDVKRCQVGRQVDPRVYHRRFVCLERNSNGGLECIEKKAIREEGSEEEKNVVPKPFRATQ